jgi:hypothetical protein
MFSGSGAGGSDSASNELARPVLAVKASTEKAARAATAIFRFDDWGTI